MANRRGEELTDEQWAVIEPLIPEPPRRDDGRGRPWKDTREVMNGVLWILRSGARWSDRPERYGKYQSVPKRLARWTPSGVWERVFRTLVRDTTTSS